MFIGLWAIVSRAGQAANVYAMSYDYNQHVSSPLYPMAQKHHVLSMITIVNSGYCGGGRGEDGALWPTRNFQGA